MEYFVLVLYHAAYKRSCVWNDMTTSSSISPLYCQSNYFKIQFTQNMPWDIFETHTKTHNWIYIYIYILCIYIYIYAYVYVYKHIYIYYISGYVNMYIYIILLLYYIFVFMYTYIQTFIPYFPLVKSLLIAS